MFKKDLTGMKFGEWTVLSFSHTKNKISMWICICSCGNKKIIKGSSLTNGSSKSCHGGQNTQFKKGDNMGNKFAKDNTPWNKGVKTGIVPKTAFKKGNNAKEITWEVDNNGCWNCTSHSKTIWGYPQIMFNNKNKKISQVMYLRHKGEIPKGAHVLHRCDNPSCINPDHLFLGTHNDNMKDKFNKNRQHHPLGIKNGVAKLTERDVKMIKFGLPNLNHKEVAEKLNVTPQHISNIRNGKYWIHVKEQ